MTDVRDKIKLRKPDGTIIAELPAYRSLYEVPLNRYIDFIKAEEPLHDKEKLEAGEVNVARVLAKAVGEFFGVSITDAMQAHYGQIDDLPSGGLQSLYVWIANLVGTFKRTIREPHNCYFDYKGERYKIPIIGRQTLSALPLLPDLETWQMVEAYEIRRIAKRQIDATKDPDGSGLYSYYLQLLAVIALKVTDTFRGVVEGAVQYEAEQAKKEGREVVPIGEAQIENFINTRALHFAEIDAGTALDVDFFLAGLMRPSEVTGAAVGTLSNHATGLVQRIARRAGRNKTHTTGHSNTPKKSLKKSDTGKSTSNSLKGRGLSKPVKVPSKR